VPGILRNFHERLGAVVPCADRDVVRVEEGADIVRVHAFER
jgi:hypothetical protein